MRLFIFLVLFLISCQGQISNWFSQWRDYSLTQMASQATDGSLTESDREDLLFLFDNLRIAKNCNEVQSYVESDRMLYFFEKTLDLQKGFLFDEFKDYSYEASLFQTSSRSAAEAAVFSIVSVWKTKFSIQEINEVIDKVSKCYPREYYDFA